MDIKLDKRLPMICASADAEQRTYHVHHSKRGEIWLVADQPNAADNIYVEGGKGSEGFGGRTLSFTIANGGGEIKLVGPWHSNADSLFAATGIDVRDKYHTWGIISRGVEYEKDTGVTILIDVLYVDTPDTWVLGTYKRIEDMAQRMADERDETLYCYSRSQGGSHSGPVVPTNQKAKAKKR